jgi:hypothetical protein
MTMPQYDLFLSYAHKDNRGNISKANTAASSEDSLEIRRW